MTYAECPKCGEMGYAINKEIERKKITVPNMIDVCYGDFGVVIHKR